MDLFPHGFTIYLFLPMHKTYEDLLLPQNWSGEKIYFALYEKND